MELWEIKSTISLKRNWKEIISEPEDTAIKISKMKKEKTGKKLTVSVMCDTISSHLTYLEVES